MVRIILRKLKIYYRKLVLGAKIAKNRLVTIARGNRAQHQRPPKFENGGSESRFKVSTRAF